MTRGLQGQWKGGRRGPWSRVGLNSESTFWKEVSSMLGALEKLPEVGIVSGSDQARGTP